MIVGITGGIGSGKTLVASYFSQLGLAVYHSDAMAKKLMLSENIRSQVIHIFGEKAYNKQGLNRSLIAEIIFRDKKKRKQLNDIVHPAVYKDFNNWKTSLDHRLNKLIIKEAAILFESGGHKYCDWVIAILAKKSIRIQRIMDRDGITREQVLARMNTQWSQKKLKALSNQVIVNNKTVEDLQTKVEKAYEELKETTI